MKVKGIFCHLSHHTLCPKDACNEQFRKLLGIHTFTSQPALICQKCTSMQHSEIPPNLEATDEVLERTAGADINNV